MLTPFSHPFLRGWRNWDDVNQLQREVNKLFDSTFGRGRAAAEFPPVSVAQTDENVIVTVEVPGVSLEDLALTVEKDTLVVSGKRPERRAGENDVLHRQERYTGSFTRAITLPSRIDADGVKATYTRGILTVTLPRAAEDKPRSIKVTVNG